MPTTITYGTGTPPARTLSWDDMGRLETDTLVDGSQTTVAAYGYGYDADGNPTSVDVDLGGNPLDGVHQYDYDRAGRLTSWTDPDQATVAYSWDGAGNRTGAGTDSFSYDQRNRLVASPDGTHTHHPRGTLSSIGTVDYDFDALGRLIAADTVSSPTTRWTASPNGTPSPSPTAAPPWIRYRTAPTPGRAAPQGGWSPKTTAPTSVWQA